MFSGTHFEEFNREKHIFPKDAAGFIPPEGSDAKVFVWKMALIGYRDIGKSACEVELYVPLKERSRWSTKGFWQEFYRIPFKKLGYRCMVARTDNPLVVDMLQREGWIPYHFDKEDGDSYYITPSMIRHRTGHLN